jgi:hypothetical protein
MSDEEYTVVVIEHRGGIDAWVCEDDKVACGTLFEWAFDWWDQEFPDEPMPHKDRLTKTYFEKMTDKGEFYTILSNLPVNRGDK